MTDKYVLDELGRPVPCRDLMEWGRWMQDANRQLAETFFGDKAIRVSTVFLGLDHAFGGGLPVLWETMVFAEEHVRLEGLDLNYQDRYITRELALEGHAAACAYVQGLLDAHRMRVFHEAMGLE